MILTIKTSTHWHNIQTIKMNVWKLEEKEINSLLIIINKQTYTQ